MRLLDFGRFLLLRRDRDHTVRLEVEEGSPPALRILTNEWKRVGNNLNQITRRLHYREEPAPPELTPLLAEIRDLLNRDYGDDR